MAAADKFGNLAIVSEVHSCHGLLDTVIVVMSY